MTVGLNEITKWMNAEGTRRSAKLRPWHLNVCEWETEEDPTKKTRSDQGGMRYTERAVPWKPSRKKNVSKKRESPTAQNDAE